MGQLGRSRSSAKHFQQNRVPDPFVDFAHFLAQPDLVNTAQLIKQNAGFFALKNHFRTTTQGLPGADDGSDDQLGLTVRNLDITDTDTCGKRS